MPQEREHEHAGHAGKPTACPETSDSAKEARDSAKGFPFFHLRTSERRRAKPSLRRKRVATMRSVNGWVKYADPTSTRRGASLDRRIDALRRGGKRASDSHTKLNAPHLGRYGRRHGSRGSNGAFLTQLDSNGNPLAETHRGGVEHCHSDPAADRAGKRRGHRGANKVKHFRVGVRDLNEINQADSSAAGADGRYGGVSGSTDSGRLSGSKITERDEHLEHLAIGDAAAGAVDGVGHAPGDPREALHVARVGGAEDDTFTVRSLEPPWRSGFERAHNVLRFHLTVT